MGKINIKEQNRGKFTAWARSHGMSVQQAASTILANREKYSPTLIKRARFAQNASRWDEGGMFNGPIGKGVPGTAYSEIRNNVMHPLTDLNVANEIIARGWGSNRDSIMGLTPQARQAMIPQGSDITFDRRAQAPFGTANQGGYKYYQSIPKVTDRTLQTPDKTYDNPTRDILSQYGYANGGQVGLPEYSTGGNIFKTVGGAAMVGLGAGITGLTGGLGTPAGLALASSGIGMMGSGISGFGDDAAVKRQTELTQLNNTQGMANAGNAAVANPYATTFNTGGRFKGKNLFGAQKNAVVGGGELVITPDKSVTAMKGPTDMNGGKGMDVQLPKDTLILSKDNSKDMLSLASKINKNKEILDGESTQLAKNSSKRNLNKYYSKILDRYNQQEAAKGPTDETQQFDGGGIKQGGYTVGNSWNSPSSMFGDPYQIDFGLGKFNTGDPSMYDKQNYTYGNYVGANNTGVPGVANATPTADNYNYDNHGGLNTNLNSLMPQFGQYGTKFGTANPVNNTLAKGPNVSTAPDGGTNWGGIASSLGEIAPMLYNMGQGLFGKRDYLNANDYNNPYEGQINSLMANRRYNIDSPLAQNEAAFRTTSANMRNLGGSRGQVMSNLTGAQNTKQFGDMAAYGQQNNVNNQYRADQAQMMYPLGRDKSTTRMSVDEANQMTDAAGRNMVGAGMTGLQQYLLTRRQMKNQGNQEKMLIDAIKAYSPYAQKWIPGLNTYNKQSFKIG